MADPTSKAMIDTFRVSELPGVRYTSSEQVAFMWLTLEQINVLRAAAGLSTISKAVARDKIKRLTRVIENLPEGS